MFGAGKTKLAQKVFADDDVMDRFSLRLWVWVSKDCTPEELLRRMLDNLGVEEEEITSALEVAKEKNLEVVGVLLFMLHLQLLDKRYLIVFDDVRSTDAWYSNLYLPAPDDKEWNRLAHGLPKGSGGAIIVTSRNEDDARRMVGRGAIHKPEPLSEEDGWKVFKEAYEAAGKKESPELEKMKEMITRKCAGLPFALQVAGREWTPSEKKEEKKEEEKDEQGVKGEPGEDKEEKATGKEPLPPPQPEVKKDEEEKKDEQGVKEEMAPGEKKEEKATDKEPLPPPPPEVKKDEEGVKKEMVPGEKQEEKSRTGDEKGKEREPPPPPVAEKKDKEDMKDTSPREKQVEKPAGGDGKEKGKEPPPPVEGKDKEAMQKETSTGGEKEKGKERPPPLEEKETKEKEKEKEKSLLQPN